MTMPDSHDQLSSCGTSVPNSGTSACSLFSHSAPTLPEMSESAANILKEASKTESTKLIEYFSPKLQKSQAAIERQVEAVEKIADEAQKQADATNRQVIILEQQLDFVKLEADSARKDAKFSKIVSIISIALSIGGIVVSVIALT
ncbi:MAG: hypothetical protein KH230_22835 [Enterocloster asparagiformis]|nr:hypothetical protein [Enterocloster asparagiformis]